MPKYRKNVPTTTISRDMVRLSQDTENIYETVMIIAKRANQIAAETKQELEAKLQEFTIFTDDAQEVFENQEQIELSRQYERLPKPTPHRCEGRTRTATSTTTSLAARRSNPSTTPPPPSLSLRLCGNEYRPFGSSSWGC